MNHLAYTPDAGRRGVLIVEDDDRMRPLLADLARQAGFGRTVFAVGIEEALERLAGGVFEMALVDLALGAEDGVDLIAAIRTHRQPALQSLPVVVVSRSATAPRIKAALDAGADGFVAKPITPAAFYRQVAMATKNRRPQQIASVLELE